ncbi:prenyltransferase/squalene oxidase repeat-containing protein [Candidatus Uabimicrobium sp. HlEnr_7]|uniref:prenyltransferase/squalene oxidase repeat-containing protein n=1 Tax=Candidatus Uabimicrobium helgolandensis TaxID=3095367 RepID=UPI0035562D3A
MNILKLLPLILICLTSLFSNEDIELTPEEHRENRRAINLGISYLIKNQQEDGSFAGKSDRKYAVAVTSFAGLSLMAAGNLPQKGEHGVALYKALQYVLSAVGRGGYISKNIDDSKMHGHCYAALFLAQICGSSRDYSDELSQNPAYSVKSVREALERSIKTILEAQTNEEGGWGYIPGDGDHEGSITVCAIQALRAARNVGVHVPKSNIDRAIRYIRNSANGDGTFMYRLGMTQRRKSFPLSAAGVSSLNGTGEYDSPEIKRGLKFMMQYLPPNGKKDQFYNRFFYYGHFYAVQAMFHAPEHTGYWKIWYPAVRKEFLKLQNKKNGSWGGRTPFNTAGHSLIGDVYATAVSTLILQVPYRYLPIFQK